MLLLLLLLQPLTVLSCSWLDATGFSRGSTPLSSHCSLCCTVALPLSALSQRPAPLAMSRLRSPEGSRGPYGPFERKMATAIQTIT